ncbi:MAG: HEAT repeat domain-containing protein [Bacteroidota bacterium]
MKEEIKQLLENYGNGRMTAEDEVKIEQYIESGDIDLSQLEDLTRLNHSYRSISTPDPSPEMTAGFYGQLHNEEYKLTRKTNFKTWWTALWSHQPVVRWAYSIALVAAGLTAGFLINDKGGESNDQIENLASEVLQMKEMMMLTLIEKESTSDRLKAVSLTSEMSDASSQVINALIQTLNNDENVNVRLSAMEALYPYAENPEVRTALVQSISQQDSPLMQVALAEMMVNLQEKKSVEELRKILKQEDTPDEIKERVKESIDVLI